jgi:hypothetical protein
MKKFIVEALYYEGSLRSQSEVWAESTSDACNKYHDILHAEGVIVKVLTFRAALPDLSQWETKA